MNIEQLYDEGTALYDDGKYESAIERYMEAKALAEKEGDDRLGAILQMEMAMSAEALGWMKTATKYYKEAKAGLDKFGDVEDRATCASNYGGLIHQLGHEDGRSDHVAKGHGGALAQYKVAQHLLEDGSDDLLLANVYFNTANVHNCQGLHEEAVAGWMKAFSIYAALELPVKMANLAFALGDAIQHQGRYEEADYHLQLASSTYREAGLVVKSNRVERVRAHAFHHLGDLIQAEQVLRRCIGVFTDYDQPADLLGAWSDLAFTLAAQGKTQEAIDGLNKAGFIADGTELYWDSHRHAEMIEDFEAGGSAEHEHPDSHEASRFGADFSRALEFAAEVHSEHRRKTGDGDPEGSFYMGHLLGTAALVIEDGGSEAEAIAALLHDVVEDTATSVADVEVLFGREVAAIVRGCTDAHDEPKPPWRERKEQYLDHLEDARDETLRVSNADKLYNARTIVADLRDIGSTVWERFTKGKESQLWYYRALADSYLEHNPGRLADELNRVVTQMEELSEVS